MKDFIEKHTKLVIIVVAVIALILLIKGFNSFRQEKAKEEKATQTTDEILAQINEVDVSETSDSLIMQMQEDLKASYGSLPDGYLWDVNGDLLSQGDKDMTAEEVVYAYLNGLQSLDMSSVQRYSRDSTVIDTYSGYFDETNKNTDYTDSFTRNIYRDCLLSLQVEGIQNSSVFAENKQVFTVKVNMLDLTQKDFWQKDKLTIYKNLELYGSSQSDSTKADMYLYDYILRYYEGGEALTRDVTFDLTLQRYPDLDTGWLVSIDTDVDSACRYADGKLVVSYINEMYRLEGNDVIEEAELKENPPQEEDEPVIEEG